MFFELKEKIIKGNRSQAHQCPCCKKQSSYLVTSMQYLSLSFFSLFPTKVQYGFQCTSCQRITYRDMSNEKHLFPMVESNHVLNSFSGLALIAGLLLIVQGFASLTDSHEQSVRVQPKVGDILFVDYANYAGGTTKNQLPLRMAKVVRIEPESDTVVISFGNFTYGNDKSIERDFAGKNYLFKSYFKKNEEVVAAAQLRDTNTFYETKRPFSTVKRIAAEQVDNLTSAVRGLAQQINELIRLFRLFS